MGKLTATKLRVPKNPDPAKPFPAKLGDGDGLFLLTKFADKAKTKAASQSWVLRIQVDKKRRDLGLGALDLSDRSLEAAQLAAQIPILDRRLLTLAEAREKAAVIRRMMMAGIDPAEERKKAKLVVPTFEKAARDCHGSLKAGWRNARHEASWLSSLEAHAFPAFGDKPVNAIDSGMVRDALEPIWLKRAETASRVLQRVGYVLQFAQVKGWRADEGSLKSVRKGLPPQPKRNSHFEAMPYAEVPAFFRSVAAAEVTVGRDALQFTILNAVRSNETRLAVWSEFDLDAGLWTIPAARMKMNDEHVVPIAPASVALLRRRWDIRASDNDHVFVSKPGKPISDMTMTKILRDAGIAKITVHGFRSSFTDWAAEQKVEVPKEAVDAALAHALPDKVAAAYRRTKYLDMRRPLMVDWANYLATHKDA